MWVGASRVLGVTTALYRRYRPETFAEVVGQDHVTAPLRQALRSGQTNHAYLFSGPRGCGKTTSARILARCLNCAQGPTDTPCGLCPSCVDLARGGSGSLDVVEIDAASHGGVDDARDLRERATFAPARDRYKVFILDEAHMVSPQGFNALLKIVEEPPEHVKFIFATTEPDKVIGTIRSRTHHYPFRLVPPDVMVDYLDQLCRAEDVQTGSGVLPLVVRAGGGSVRDSLSVLDQLIAGSGPTGLVYEDAVALLGYTHASLLDDLVEALAARDGGSAFRVVERVISTGHEPRRFVEDLLERLRDLIVLAASGDAAAAVLRDIPGDQMTRMQTQARQLGAAELSRSADLVNAALSEMTGATSPRLHLELLMARLLLPALDDSAAGLGARIDRLERDGVAAAGASRTSPERVDAGTGGPGFRPVAAVEPVAGGTPRAVVSDAVPADRPEAGAGPAMGGGREVEAVQGGGSGGEAPEPGGAARADDWAGRDDRSGRDDRERSGQGAADGERRADADPVDTAALDVVHPVPVAPAAPVAATEVGGTGSRPATADAAPAPRPHADAVPQRSATHPAAPPHDVPSAVPVARAERPGGAAGSGDTEVLRRRWPEVLETLRRLKKTTWVLISQNAQVVELDATTLKLGFAAEGLASAFRAGSHADLVQQAVRETLGFTVKVEPVLSGAAPTAPVGGAASTSGAGSGTAGGGPSRGGAPSVADAAASWDAPATRSAPVPSPTAASPTPASPTRPSTAASGTSTEASRGAGWRGGHGRGGGASDGAEPVADDDPDAADADKADADKVDAGAGDADNGDAGSGDAAGIENDPAGAAGRSADRAGRTTAPVGLDGLSSASSTPTTDGPSRPDPAAGPSARAAGVGDSRRSGRARASLPVDVSPPPPWDIPDPEDPGAPEPPADDWAPEPPTGADRVRAAARAAATGSAAASAAVQNGPAGSWADDEPSMDDPDISATGLSGVPLLAQMLSATVIDEQVDEGL